MEREALRSVIPSLRAPTNSSMAGIKGMGHLDMPRQGAIRTVSGRGVSPSAGATWLQTFCMMRTKTWMRMPSQGHPDSAPRSCALSASAQRFNAYVAAPGCWVASSAYTRSRSVQSRPGRFYTATLSLMRLQLMAWTGDPQSEAPHLRSLKKTLHYLKYTCDLETSDKG